jgi:hypothetical protein
MTRTTRVTGAILAGSFLAARPALAQCAMCGSAVSFSQVGRGIYFSILFLLGISFTLVGGLVLIAARADRKTGVAAAEVPLPRALPTTTPDLGAPSRLGATPRY